MLNGNVLTILKIRIRLDMGPWYRIVISRGYG